MALNFNKVTPRILFLIQPTHCGVLSDSDNCFIGDYGMGNEEVSQTTAKEKARSLFLKPKQRDKMAHMLSDVWQINGFYLHVDSKGNVLHSFQITVDCRVNPSSNIEVRLFDRARVVDNNVVCVWTNKNKIVRIKHAQSRKTSKLNKKQRKHNRLKERKIATARVDKKIKPKRKKDSSLTKKNRPVDDDEHSKSSEDAESSDSSSSIGEEDEEPRKAKLKKLPRKMSYIFSDAYICRKRSKKYKERMECFLHDVVIECDPLTARQHSVRYATTVASETDEEDCLYSSKYTPTLGDFFTPQHFTQLGLTSQLEPITTECEDLDEDSDIRLESDKTASAPAIDISNEHENIVKGLENKGETSNFEEQITIDTTKDRLKKYDITLSNHAIITLSRSSLRPDNLSAEFTDKYKEANCKNRRFVLNIRQLAQQHLTRMQLLPLNVISYADLSLYMIFVYVTEVEADKDKYRVWINSNLPLIKPKEMFHELITKALTSIHELLQKAMEALDNPTVIQCIINTRKIKKDSMTQLPVCTFHLLWSMRLKSKLTDSSLSISDTLSVKGHAFSTSYHKAQQGPTTSFLCGICLHEFNINNSFPIALTVCSHWFCEECWELKLCAQIKKHEYENVLCIERGCSYVVDQTTLLSILDIKMILKLCNNSQNIIREKSNVMTCPNNACQHSVLSQNPIDVLQQNKPDQYMPIRCSCHWQYCSKCRGSPHWPVNCDISNIYNKCLDAQCLNSFNRTLIEDELPDLVLRGKSCPRCGTFIQEKNNQSKFEKCACGSMLCWPCGKAVDVEMKDAHSTCFVRFEHSNMTLKAKMMKRATDGESDIQINRWFKVALTHRQMRHPQVVNILYAMADRIASRVCEVSESGKYIGDVKMGSSGWKSFLRKWNVRMCKRLRKSELVGTDNCSNTETSSCSDGRLSVLSCDSIDNGLMTEDTDIDFTLSLSARQMPVKKESLLIFKAISNIVQIKLEVHHIIEHTAVMLEFEHALSQPGNSGKIIRSLERAEDLCEALGLLLQDPHKENIPRIIPSFLRLRLQVTNMLSTLYSNLKLVNY